MLSKSCPVCLQQIICFKSIFSLLSERFNALCSQQLSFRYNTDQFYNFGAASKTIIAGILHVMKTDIYGNTYVRCNLRYVDNRELKEGREDNQGIKGVCVSESDKIWEKNFVKVAGFFKMNFLFPPFYLNVSVE